ncbi:MAG: DUF4012 domain-containing protein [Patescibacteria group bacterium]
MRKTRRKPLKLFGLVLLLLVIFSFFAIYLPFRSVKVKGAVIAASAKELKNDLKAKNIDLIQKRMNTIDVQYKDLEKESKRLYWLSFIPYIADFKNGIEAGHYVLSAGQESVKAIYPYAELIGLKQKADSVAAPLSADEKLATAVLTLDKMISKIDPISEDIRQAEIRLNKINPNRYPKKIGKTVVRENIITLKEQFNGVESLFVGAKPLLKNLPEMLGANGEKTYLVLYNNEMEQRPEWGFLTYYAVFTIKDGRMKVESSQDMYHLDDSIAVHPPAPRLISTYHINVPKFNIRDSNLSPDFVESMKLFNSLYEKSGNKVKYDGVIAVDSKLLVDLLKIYGNAEVDGVNFSAEPTAVCDCPQVIYKLFDLVDRPTPYLRENRKAILGDLMQELMRKVFGRGTLLGSFTQSMFKSLDEKHIVLYFNDPDLQKSVESLNYAGRIREYEGDFLHVNNANFAGAKSNLFVEKTLTSTTTIKGDTIERTIVVDFKNPHAASDCNLERAGLCLNAKLRNLMRVYVPKGSQLISMKGGIIKDKDYKQYDELGKTVFEAYNEVLPLGKGQVTFTYRLPSSISAKNYKLLIQKQPGEETMKLKVDMDGAIKYDGLFEKDKEIKQ